MRGSFSPVIAPQLSAAQHRFLGLFLGDPGRLRTAWTHEGRVIAPATDLTPPEGATTLLAYRVSDGGYSFKGATETRRTLSLRDLAALAPLWRTPLRELTEGGAALASAPAPPALVVRSFKLSPAEDRALTLAAARSGETVSDLLRRLIAAEI